jgi:hypothetical protein
MRHIEKQILEFFDGGDYIQTDEGQELIESVETFEDAGFITQSKGVVIKTTNGREIHITLSEQ